MGMKYINIFIMIFIVIGCEGPQGNIGPVGENGPRLSGSLVGFVNLVDSSGEVAKDNSGVKITIFPGDISDTTVTDSSGRWELKNVESGIKTIAFQKGDYFSEEMEGVQFIGDGTLYLERMPMFLFPNYFVSSVGYSINTADTSITIMGSVTTNSLNQPRSIILCFDTSYTVSPNDGRFLFYEIVGLPYNSIYYSHTIVMNSAFKDRVGITKGTKLFIAARSCSPYAPKFVYSKTKGKLLPAYFGNPPAGTPIGIPEFFVP